MGEGSQADVSRTEHEFPSLQIRVQVLMQPWGRVEESKARLDAEDRGDFEG